LPTTGEGGGCQGVDVQGKQLQKGKGKMKRWKHAQKKTTNEKGKRSTGGEAGGGEKTLARRVT